MCGKRHRNRAHLAIAVFLLPILSLFAFLFHLLALFFSSLSVSVSLCMSLSLAHAKRVWNIRTSIFHYCVFGIQFNTQSYNVYIWTWMPCENDGKHTKNRYHKNLKGKTKYINMYTNTSKATDTRVFRMPDKREPILAKIYTIFCLTHGSTVNTFYWCALLQCYSVLFILLIFFSFSLFILCVFLFQFHFISFHYCYYYYLFVVDERVALSSNLCILVLFLDFRIFRLKLNSNKFVLHIRNEFS